MGTSIRTTVAAAAANKHRLYGVGFLTYIFRMRLQNWPLRLPGLLFAGILLLAGCTADLDSLHTGYASGIKPSYLRKHITAAPKVSDRELLEEALSAEQVYIDMLADFALGRFDNGLLAGGGSLMEAIRPYLGTPYRWGGTSRAGIDCSGFTMQVFRRLGIRLPHNSAAQAHYGAPVPRSRLRAGDLIFFAVGSKTIDHVGLMINSKYLAHCSSRRGRCAVEPLSRTYPKAFAGARRLLVRKQTADN